MEHMVDIVAHANGFLENGSFIPREICLAHVYGKWLNNGFGCEWNNCNWFDKFCRCFADYEEFTVVRSDPIQSSNITERDINEFKTRKFHHLPLSYEGGQVYENYVTRRVRSIHKKLGGGRVGVIGKEQFHFFANVCKLPRVIDLQNYIPRFEDLIDYVDEMSYKFSEDLHLHDNVHEMNDTSFCSTKIACYVARYVKYQRIPEKKVNFWHDTDEIDDACLFYLKQISIPEEEVVMNDPEWYYKYFNDDDLEIMFKNSIDTGIFL